MLQRPVYLPDARLQVRLLILGRIQRGVLAEVLVQHRPPDLLPHLRPLRLQRLQLTLQRLVPLSRDLNDPLLHGAGDSALSALLQPQVRRQIGRRHPLLLEVGEESSHLVCAPLRLRCGRTQLLAVQRDVVAPQLVGEAARAVPAYEPVHLRLSRGASAFRRRRNVPRRCFQKRNRRHGGVLILWPPASTVK